jgi:hypothetical protein
MNRTKSKSLITKARLIPYFALPTPIGGIGHPESPNKLDPTKQAYDPKTQTYDPDAIRAIFNNTVSTIIGFMTVLAGLWFMFQIFAGAYAWLTAGGDSSKLNAGKQRLTNALIGLTIIVSAYTIAGLIGRLFGLDLYNPLIKQVFPN